MLKILNVKADLNCMKQRCYTCGTEFRGNYCRHCCKEVDMREMKPSLPDYLRLLLLALSSHVFLKDPTRRSAQ